MTVAVSVLRRLYMLGLGALALSFWGICGIAVLIFIAIVWMRTADFALLVYKNHFIIAWLVGASIAMLALFIDWVGRRRSRTLTISTQDGFWGSAAFAAAVATVIGMGVASKIYGEPGARDVAIVWPVFFLVTVVMLAIFLWPAARNLFDVWRALPRRRAQAASRRSTSLPSSSDLKGSSRQVSSPFVPGSFS